MTTSQKKRKFLIEKVAEDFVQTILKDHPVMLYQLDEELSEYITNNEQIDKKFKDNSLELTEYRSSSQGYQMDARINQELISEAEMLHTQGAFPHGYVSIVEYTTTLLDNGELTMYYLVHLVLKNDNVRIRTMHEIEEEGLDVGLPNEWVYHKDSDIDEILNYIKDGYDFTRQIQEEEEEDWDEDDIKYR